MAADSDFAEAGSGAELAALSARVAELERQVAVLTSSPRAALAEAPPRPRPPVPPMRAIPAMPAREPVAPLPPPLPAAPQRSLEDRLGSQIFNLIGLVAIIVATATFLKLAIERGWVGPVARVLIGIVAGVAIVLWSERFRRKGFAAFSYSMKALGSGILYLSLWAAFQLYHLLPATVALLAMMLVTAWNGFMAWSQDSELLAAYGLIGGFATPLLLATGGNHETFLFSYVASIDLAIVLLMRWKPWRRLLLPTFVASAGYFAGWYAKFFHEGVPGVLNGESYETAAFALLFFALFAVLSVKSFRRENPGPGEIVMPVLVPLANAAFLALTLSAILENSGQHGALTWLMVVLAALFLGLMRIQATAVAAAMHLACAVIFLTIAIPLKASGHTLTTAWLVEGLVLYWASTRVEAESGAPARVLSILSLGGYILGLVSLAWHWVWMGRDAGFFNRDLGAALVAIAALAGAAWLAQHPPRRDRLTLLGAFAAIDLVAVLLTAHEIWISPSSAALHTAFANAEFATALVGLAVIAASAWAASRLADPETTLGGGKDDVRMFAAASVIAFNLLTLFSITREIDALWAISDAGLGRSLAISGFLMAYAAVLLAAGFWRRSAFVRWQGLILLVFTIAKVFLYDISGLSQGYRVASFLALGVLLMGISFAYQKDWLGLRAVPPAAAEEQP